MMPSLELAEEPVPLWWTTDFILASPEGTPKEEEKWIVGEFQLLLRGHLEVPGRLLQGGHPQRLLRRHHGGGQGGGQEVRRPHGPEGSWHPLQVKWQPQGG